MSDFDQINNLFINNYDGEDIFNLYTLDNSK